MASLSDLRNALARASRVTILTGAGVSAASGIPTFRGAGGLWKSFRAEQLATPEAFARDPHLVWEWYDWRRQLVAKAEPNAAHHALARLGQRPGVTLITQNVDGLHRAAGSRNVIDLHGRLASVRCMGCEYTIPRAELQDTLLALNPAWADIEGRVAPDGDVDIEGRDYGDFVVPDCPRCGGILKPDVVFFGESVPKDRVTQAFAAVDAADALLIVGTSLMVYSGYRFAAAAAEAGKPIAAVNLGRTRADHLLTLKIAEPCERAFDWLS